MKTQSTQISRMTPSSQAITSKLSKCLAVGVLASALATSVSQAVLRVTFDMRAVQSSTASGANLTSTGILTLTPDGRTVGISSGAQVILQLVATLATADADLTNDSFTRTDGSFVSFGSTGDITGSMRSDALTTAGINNLDPFKGTGAKSGLNTANVSSPADNVLDIAGTSTSAFTSYFTSSSNAPTGVTGQTFILGETIITLGGSAGAATSIRYVPRIGVVGLAGNRANATFKIDNVTFSMNGDGGTSATNPNVADPTTFQFNPVTLTIVPEPSAFGMVLLGALSVVGFRRLGIRRS